MLGLHVEVGDGHVVRVTDLAGYYLHPFYSTTPSPSFMVRSTPSASDSSSLKRRKTEDDDIDRLQVKKSRTRVRSVIFTSALRNNTHPSSP